MPSFRRKPESRAEENGDAPVFHPPLICGNTEEIKNKGKVKCPAWDISGFRILFLIGRE